MTDLAMAAEKETGQSLPTWKTIAVAFILAAVVSAAQHHGFIGHFLFHIGLFHKEQEKHAIEQTLKLFNANFASFFNTGGDLRGLNEFPAGNLIKRRIFQDINSLKATNMLLIYDRDMTKLISLNFPCSDCAVVETEETWFLSLQNAQTRRPVSPVKAGKIKVRYLLKQKPARWEVEEFMVFGENDNMSNLPVKEF